MTTFVRTFSANEALSGERLFQECLLPDILRGEVLPAIRNNQIAFYHKGGRLFSYTEREGFKTHHKYASVLQYQRPCDPYITDSDLTAVKTFIEGYVRIKENCALFSGLEALGVADVCGQLSFARIPRPAPVVALDTEVAMRRETQEEQEEPEAEKIASHRSRVTTDRIDLLLFNVLTKELEST